MKKLLLFLAVALSVIDAYCYDTHALHITMNLSLTGNVNKESAIETRGRLSPSDDYSLTGFSAREVTAFDKTNIYSDGNRYSAVTDTDIRRSASSKVEVPPPPVALGNNVSSGDYSLVLLWSPSSTATSYLIDLSYDPSFQNYVNGYYSKSVQGTQQGQNRFFKVTGLACNTTYYFRLRAVNGSGVSGYSNVITMQTTGMPPVLPNITGPTSISCPGQTAVYWSDVGNYSNFSWQVTGGTIVSFCEGSCGESISVRWDTQGIHTVSVRYTDFDIGCTTPYKTISVSVAGRELPPPITGPLAPCEGTEQIYSIPPISDISNREWNVTGGTIVSGGGAESNSVTVRWNNALTHNISLQYLEVSQNCLSHVRTMSINVVPPPDVTFTEASESSCAGVGSSTYTTQQDMSNYVWAVPSGGTIVSGGGTSDSFATIEWHSPGSHQVNVNYTYPSTSCSGVSPAVAEVTVHPLPVAYTVSGGGFYCQTNAQSTVHLSGSQSGASYQLHVNDTEVGPPVNGTGDALLWNVTTEGIYTVIATSADCDQPMPGEAIVDYMKHNVIVSGPKEIDENPVMLMVGPYPGYSYQWKYEGVEIENATSNTFMADKTGSYQVALAYQGCSSESQVFYVARQANRYYNGIISAVQWRTDKVYSTAESEYKGMYVFDYDNKYQIKEAQWAVPDFVLNTYATGGNAFKIKDINYDPNGNILKLKRYNGSGEVVHDFNYEYKYQQATPVHNNQLQSVSGYVNAYTYNAIGQMVGEDKVEGDDQYVEYDVSGKVRKVFNDPAMTEASLKVEFIYDDRGFRMAKKNYETNKTTWYIRDASGNVMSVYEENHTHNSFTQAEIPMYGSGKLGTVYPQEQYSAAYELTDHLGNVRALIRPIADTFTAGYEDADMASEEADFNPSYDEAVKVNSYFFNHTPGGSRSQRLSAASQDEIIGLAKSLKVFPGDSLKLEVYAKYTSPASGSTDVATTILAALSSAFGLSPSSTGIGELAYQSLNAMNNSGLLINTGPDVDENVPKAYLNYILFDEHFVPYDFGFDQVSQEALETFGCGNPGNNLPPGTPCPHEKLELTPFVQVPGYAYIYLSNESNKITDVYFDDLKITQTGVYVSQATDYGPWGDVIREQKTEPDDKYRWYYQGQYAERDEETGWNHFELREYDPVIGRWLQKDPFRQYYSPYIGLGNNPITKTDPDGGKDEYDVLPDGTQVWRSDKGGSDIDYFNYYATDEMSQGLYYTGTTAESKSFFGWIQLGLSTTKNMYLGVTIEANRFIYTENSTISEFTLNGDTRYFLEPAWDEDLAETRGSDRAISPGTYSLIPHVSCRYNYGKAIRLIDVPGRTSVLIHTGNIPDHTEGCLLPGCGIGTDQIQGGTSQTTFNEIWQSINNNRYGARIIINNN